MNKNALFELIKQLAAASPTEKTENTEKPTEKDGFGAFSAQSADKNGFQKPTSHASQLKREKSDDTPKKPPTKDAILQMIRKHNELSAKIHKKNKKN